MEFRAKIPQLITELALEVKATKLNQRTVMHDLTSSDKSYAFSGTRADIMWACLLTLGELRASFLGTDVNFDFQNCVFVGHVCQLVYYCRT